HREPSVIRQLPTKVLRIGRAPDNDIVVSDLSVSRNHAELRRTASGYQIVDLDSHNGTFVNGQQIGSAPLTEGDIVGIGPSTFRLSGSELQEFVDTGDISLVARDLTVTLGNGKVLLDHVSFQLAETRTDRLSGGQQKRVNVALELMTKPSLLFLDEPTSGLDPGLDKSVMEMMSGLAKDGRTVIVVTHSVANLDICDRLLVLVP